MTDDTADPIALFDAAVAAMNREDWPAVAALCDPASLAAFRRRTLEQLDPAGVERHGVTVEAMQRAEPGLPREVAEYFATQRRESNDPARRLRDELPGVASVDEARAMAPADVFAAWLEGRSPRRRIARLVAEGRAPAAVAERLRDVPSLPAHALVAIGAVQDGDRIAHVLYRHADDDERAGDGAVPEWAAGLPDDERELALEVMHRGHPQTTTCRRQPDGTWRLLADHGLLGVGFMAIGNVTIRDGAIAGDETAPDDAD